MLSTSSISDHALNRQFVLQAEDPVFGCPVLEAKFEVADLNVVRAALTNEADDDPDLNGIYELDCSQLEAIAQAFDIDFAACGRKITLTSWHHTWDAPYLIHSGFELFLMLEGRKPFAKFSSPHPSEWLDEIVVRFKPFVDQGRFVSRTIVKPIHGQSHIPNRGKIPEMRYEYFAVVGQEWRIDADLLLFEVGSKTGWSDALERFEGSLLGYEDWQNDWWLGHRASYQNPAK